MIDDSPPMRIALFQPDIPQNTGTILRLGACFAVPIDIIEPLGFVWDDARLKRAGMDYRELAQVTRHQSWQHFLAQRGQCRLVLLTTKASDNYHVFSFQPSDILLLGRESAGVPPYVHELCDARLKVPMAQGARSLNVAVTAAMVLGEALRQCESFP
jgi:tRNA (cytidine/uridine-2'-O-)-methyltransferase